jgi:hypothetical protein
MEVDVWESFLASLKIYSKKNIIKVVQQKL